MMKNALTAYLSGTLFAIGLGIAQMTNPTKILNFLNLFGNWDPTLLVVFLGASGVYLIGYQFLISDTIKAPIENELSTKKKIDPRLILGGICFGIGWGIMGLCPGPALTNLTTLKPPIILFLISMTAGMYAVKFIPAKETTNEG